MRSELPATGSTREEEVTYLGKAESHGVVCVATIFQTITDVVLAFMPEHGFSTFQHRFEFLRATLAEDIHTIRVVRLPDQNKHPAVSIRVVNQDKDLIFENEVTLTPIRAVAIAEMQHRSRRKRAASA